MSNSLAYTVAKVGVIGITRADALDYSEHGDQSQRGLARYCAHADDQHSRHEGRDGRHRRQVRHADETMGQAGRDSGCCRISLRRQGEFRTGCRVDYGWRLCDSVGREKE
jgi:hypothetical protein